MFTNNQSDAVLIDLICEARVVLGYQDLAAELGCSPDDARALVESEWRETDDDSMYVQVIDRGTAILAEAFGTTPAVIDAFVAGYFG
jgi:hypothetical protein